LLFISLRDEIKESKSARTVMFSKRKTHKGVMCLVSAEDVSSHTPSYPCKQWPLTKQSQGHLHLSVQCITACVHMYVFCSRVLSYSNVRESGETAFTRVYTICISSIAAKETDTTWNQKWATTSRFKSVWRQWVRISVFLGRE